MLVTAKDGDGFEMLITDFKCWWPILGHKKRIKTVTDITIALLPLIIHFWDITDAQFPVNFKVHILELITTIADERFWTEWFKQNSFTR